MGGPLRPQTDAGTIVEPQAVPFGLLVGNLEPLAPPDRLDALVVDLPARPPRSLRFAHSRSGKSTRSRVTIIDAFKKAAPRHAVTCPKTLL